MSALASARDDRIRVHAGTDTGVELFAPPEREGFSFVIFGDRTGGDVTKFGVMDEGIRMTNRLDPEFVMTVGDLVEGYTDGKTWMGEVQELKEHLSALDRPWFPVVGNHDVYGSGANKATGNLELYKEHVAPLYYSFDYRWAHFVALFSDESLSFANYATDQNVSEAQLTWLRDDLARTTATQIFVFLHHPRWTYEGTNWPEVHQILKNDGRTKAIIAGHIHTWTDDGIQDGIHHHVLGSTGGAVGDLTESAHAYQIAHVRVREDGYTMSFLPVGSVHGSDLVLRDELTELGRLSRGGWAKVRGSARMGLGGRMESSLALEIENPGTRAMDVGLRFDQGGDWTWAPPADTVHLPPGASTSVTLVVGAPPFDGRRPQAALEVSLLYPLQSGVVQPLRDTQPLPIAIDGATAAARSEPATNLVLETGGGNCARVAMPADFDALTLECWVRGEGDGRGRTILGRTQSAGFNLATADGKFVGHVMVQGSNSYVRPISTTPVDRHEWAHCAFVWDGVTARLFVNGVLEDEKPAAGALAVNPRPFFIGADTDYDGNPESPFAGEIDEVRVSRVARYAVDFEPPFRHVPDDDTVLLLHFDRAFGAIAGPGIYPDASGRENHAWPVGTPRLVEGGF